MRTKYTTVACTVSLGAPGAAPLILNSICFYIFSGKYVGLYFRKLDEEVNAALMSAS